MNLNDREIIREEIKGKELHEESYYYYSKESNADSNFNTSNDNVMMV